MAAERDPLAVGMGDGGGAEMFKWLRLRIIGFIAMIGLKSGLEDIGFSGRSVDEKLCNVENSGGCGLGAGGGGKHIWRRSHVFLSCSAITINSFIVDVFSS